MYYVKALVQHILPLRFINHVIPEPKSWNGIKYNFVYVKPKLVRELHELPAPEERLRYHNAYEYYFLGFGLVYLPLEAVLHYLTDSYREGDWTFQGDDPSRPIMNLSHLFNGWQNGGVNRE